MALDFPNSPSIGDTFSGSGTTWVWDGTSWTVQSPTATFAATTELADHESATTSVHGISDTAALATKSYADTAAATAAAGVVDAAPATLDTLNELAAALGDDANFATTVTNSLAGKADLSGADFTGDVTTTGNVGIGTTAPSQMLEVYGASPYIRVSNTDETNAGIEFTDAQAPNNQNAAVYFSSSTNALQFSTNSTERLRITSGGAVGIGTTSPEATLDVAGDIKSSGVVTSAAGALDQAINFSAAGSVLDNLPARVHPAEQLLKQAVWWIDAAHSSASGQSIKNLGWGGSALDAQCGSTGSADSNDPKYLDWQGENYVYLPGAAGNSLSVPDEAALDITGDIDIRVHVALDAWSGSIQGLINKWLTPNQSFSFLVQSTGVLQFNYSDGTSNNNTTSTVATGLSAGETKWLRVTMDADNGAGGHDINFYMSDDGSTWTQLGTTRTIAGTTSLHAGTANITVGWFGGASSFGATAKVYRAQVLNGIDGTPVLDIDCSQIASGADTSFTALTGQTVSINRSTSGRKTVGVVHPRWLFGTDDYMQVADNDLIDFGASDSFTVLAVLRQWDSPSFARIISKEVSGTGVEWYLRNRDNDEYDAAVSDGTTTVERRYAWLSDDLNVLAMVVDRDAQTLQLIDTAGSSATPSIASVGSLVNSNNLRIGSFSGGGFYNDMEFTAAAIWRRALTAGEIATLNSYFQGRG